MTNLEKDKLIKYYEANLKGGFAHMTNIIVVVVGFSLATLSSSAIPSVINFWLMVFALICFGMLLFFDQRSERNELKKHVAFLKNKYSKDRKVLDVVASYDIRNGLHKRAFQDYAPILISLLFMLYSLVEHGLRTYPI